MSNTIICVKRFGALGRPYRYGAVQMVAARNSREAQFKRLTGPMGYGDAVYHAEILARQKRGAATGQEHL